MTDDLQRIADALAQAATPGETTITITVDDGAISTNEARIVSLLRARLSEMVDIDGLNAGDARDRLHALESLCAEVLEGDHGGPVKALAVRVLAVIRGDSA